MQYITSLLLVLCLFSHQYSTAQSAEEYFELAKGKVEEGEYNYALTLIDKCIELDETNPEYKLIKVELYLQKRNLESAMTLLKGMIQADSTEGRAYEMMGLVYGSLNSLDRSLAYFNKAIKYAKSEEESFHYHVVRATIKGLLRDFEGSLVDLEYAYSIDSNNISILNNLTTLYQEIGKRQRGITILKRVIELDSSFIGSYVNLGLIYSEIDSLEQSKFYFDGGMKINPEEPILLNNRGYLFYKMKDYRRALSDINKSIDLYPANSYAYRNRPLVYLAVDMMEEACSDLSIADLHGFHMRYGNKVKELLKKFCEED